jgi:DnaA-homolog protein
VEQLVFELAVPEPPSFANFLAGRNAELVDALSAFVTGGPETGMLIWGGHGVGKTHLARAAIALADERGLGARMFAHPREIDDEALAAVRASAEQVIAIDGIDLADEAAAARLFTLYNEIKERQARLIATSRTPLAALSLREDLRTRLGWGLVYELLALEDEAKPAALAVYARARGIALSGDVIEYLLRHGRRDMPSLLATLVALDRQSLATKRPITVPLLKAWLQREREWKPAAADTPHSA